MPDIQITDQLDKPVDGVKIDLEHPSSLLKYLKSKALHLAVLPDFIQRKDELLTTAAPKPISFAFTAQHSFQLGSSKPEITVKPSATAALQVNATPGSNLFAGDPFQFPVVVPKATGYVGLSLQGSLNLGVSGSSGDLTFGLNRNASVTLEYDRAFPLGEGEPTLAEAVGETLSTFTIPADLSDLTSLGVGDVASVSGSGSLKVSGGVKVGVSPNPLATVNLPLGAGAISVKAGATAGLAASFVVSGSYQIRVRRKSETVVELSVLQESGTKLTADFSASAGVTASFGDTDLISTLLDAVSTNPADDKKLLADLSASEAKAFADVIKQGLDHSVAASVDEVLTALTDDQAAFQYEIQPDRLSPAAANAVHLALDGDFSALTALEQTAKVDGTLAPGIVMLNSVFSATVKKGSTLKLNLLGILNYISIGELTRNGEVLTDPATGDVTIKDTVKEVAIGALTEPLRNEALRKAMFDSVLITTTYLAGRAITLPTLECSQMHFALNDNTNKQTMRDYLTWFVALDLLTREERAATLAAFTDGGRSACILRTSFNDADCKALFFDGDEPRQAGYYLKFGRQALQALLDPENQEIDALRFRLLDDAHWPKALETGANRSLGPLVGLHLDDVRIGVLIGDVFDITQWADAMSGVGALVKDVRAFVGNADPGTLADDNTFKQKRDALQGKMASALATSKTVFHEPWGMVSLFWAAGSPATAYAKATTQSLTVERGAKPKAIAA